MARPIFPATNDSLVLSVGGYPQAGIPVRVYTRQTGGTQITDLTYVGADGSTIGAAVTSGILYSDSNGLLPVFAGPDGGPTTVWADHGMSGERLALTSDPTGTGGGGGAVSSVVGQTGAVTGTHILADTTVSTALALKAPLASPTFTGNPSAPTASPGDNDTTIATTAFVTAADAATATTAASTFAAKAGATYTGTHNFTGATVTGISSGGATVTLDSDGTLVVDGTTVEVGTDAEIAAAIAAGNSAAVSTAGTNAAAIYAPLASPALTGNPTAPTATAGDNDTSIATTAFTAAAVAVETARATTAEGLAAAKSANLSDLASASTARTNLGLAAAATMTTAQIAADSALTVAFGPILNVHLTAWALAGAYRLVSATRDSNDVITTASVVWPDGSTGTFTTDTTSAIPNAAGAIDSYHITYVNGTTGTKTVTQTAVTRDSTSGAVTAQPALTVV